MKTTAFITSILPLAVAATAAPAVENRNEDWNGGSRSYCSANDKQVCCNGLLDCVVQALSSTCTGNAYYCRTDAPKARGAIVNVELLDCAKIL